MNKTVAFLLVLLLCFSVICGAVVYGNLSAENKKQNLNPNSTPSSSQDKTATPTPDPTPIGPPLEAIIVPDDFPTIQQAVNNASDGDTVYVRSGQYNESVTINKSLCLMGEDKQARIDANSVAPDLLIVHDNVNVTGFSMVNTPTPGSDGPFWMPNYVYPTYKSAIVIRGSANCHIFGNSLSSAVAGVLLENSVQCSITDNEAGGGNGVELQSSTGNYVADNVVNGAATGLWIEKSANNTFVNNIISRTVTGVWLSAASGNTFKGNLLVSCFYNFGITGSERLDYINDVDASNLIDGKPIIYWVGKTGQVVPANASCIILADCRDMVIQDFSLALSYRGIVLANTNDSVIRNTRLGSVNTTWQEDFGQKALDIQLVSSFGNSIESNYGNVWLNFSSNNRITHNTGVIRIENSNSNQITQNTITPISFLFTDRGIQLSNSANNRIQGNTISNGACGIFLGDYANSNIVIENEIYSNRQGGIDLRKDYINGVLNSDSNARPSFNIIYKNIITDNGNNGIYDSGYCTSIIGNSLIKNQGWGLESASENCSLIGNVVEGIKFSGTNYNIIGNNLTVNSVYGQYDIEFSATQVGVLYHNNFLYYGSIDWVAAYWDNGSEGNYWINYNGVDSNGDGIGDTPYFAVDRYPLMTPFDITTVTPPPP